MVYVVLPLSISHSFELLHDGQKVLAAFLDAVLLLLQPLLLLQHLLLRTRQRTEFI